MISRLAFLIFCVYFLNGSPISFRSLVSEKEFECFSQEKIYHKPTDKCYKLLTTGPCRRGQWFVLEKPKGTLRGASNATIKAKCIKEICPNGEYYWSKTKSCVRAQDKKRLCGDNMGQELLTNVFGEGECMCTRDPPGARYNEDSSKRCYPLYSQGPCPSSQIFGYSEKFDRIGCWPDPCYAETIYRKQNRLIGKDAILAPINNGTCYELGTRGPCPEGFTFKVHPKIKQPHCGSLLNQIFEGIRPCNLDVNGHCQKEVSLKKKLTANKYFKELEIILAKK